MTLPVILLGAGGHARVLIDILRLRAIPLLGVAVPEPSEIDRSTHELCVIGDDEAVCSYSPGAVLLVNGLGAIKITEKRQRIFEYFKCRDYYFTQVIHPSAVISHDVHLAEGVQIMAGAVIQTGSRVGKNTIVNTRASVDHDCLIGDHVHLAPGVTLSGGVVVGAKTHIGTGAVVIQGIRIGKKATVAAGAVVVSDIADHAMVGGIPARMMNGDVK